jgi:hypothetical protein
MIRKMLCAAVLVIAVALSVPAKAATYNASFDGSVFDVFAQITTDGLNNVTAISGTVSGVNGAPISGLVAPGNPWWNYDNKFFSSDPHVTNDGILFNAGGYLYNLYTVGSSYLLSTFNPNGSLIDPTLNGSLYNPGDVGSLTVAQTPLPGALWLFGSALAGFWGLIVRRRRSSAQRLDAPAFA